MKFFACAVIVLFALNFKRSLAAPAENLNQEEAANNDELEPSAAADDGLENVRFRKAAPPAQGPPQGKSIYGSLPPPSAPVGYGPAPGPVSYSYPSPAPVVPCARNLLFSCQPSVAPVPCSAPPHAPLAPAAYGPAPSAPAAYAPAPVPAPAPAPSQGYAGAYSEPVPQWVMPVMPQFSVPTVREVMYGYY